MPDHPSAAPPGATSGAPSGPDEAARDLLVDFKRAMRRYASTVTIVTATGTEGERFGITATAVSSLSADPPSLLVCVNRSTSLHDPLIAGRRFCVNVLHTEHELLVPAFSGGLKGEDRFSVGDWSRDTAGTPYLRNAQSCLFCEVEQAIPYATHTIVIGRVARVIVDERIDPLLYADGRLAAAR